MPIALRQEWILYYNCYFFYFFYMDPAYSVYIKKLKITNTYVNCSLYNLECDRFSGFYLLSEKSQLFLVFYQSKALVERLI